MAEQRKTYTTECKQEAVRLVTEQRYGMAEAARNLGMNANMLRRWKRALTGRQNGAFPGKGQGAPEQEELQRLRAEVKRLRMERGWQKSPGLLCQPREWRDACMTQADTPWPVSVLCAVLEVSRSGFYAYRQRHASARPQEAEVALLARVKAIAPRTRSSYGRRRMAKQ